MTVATVATMSPRRRGCSRRALAAATTIMVVVAGACSGSSESGGETDVSTTTTTTPSAPQTVVDGDASSDPAATPPVTEPGDAPTVSATIAPTDATPPDEGASPPGDQGGQTLGPLGETEVELETQDGTVQIGGGDVPDAAAQLPLPDDFIVLLSSETPTALGVTGTTTMAFADVVALYDDGLASSGFDITNREVTGELFAVFDFESDTEDGNVLIATTPGSTDITVTVALADR